MQAATNCSTDAVTCCSQFSCQNINFHYAIFLADYKNIISSAYLTAWHLHLQGICIMKPLVKLNQHIETIQSAGNKISFHTSIINFFPCLVVPNGTIFFSFVITHEQNFSVCIFTGKKGNKIGPKNPIVLQLCNPISYKLTFWHQSFTKPFY